MSVTLIFRDGKRVGIAPADDQGIGVLTWFHANVLALSMDHALKHEGFSVETVDEVDCGEVADLIDAVCARKGVTMVAEFVPLSQSRNAKSGAGGKPWRSLNWRVTIKNGFGREIITTDYSQGEGWAPTSKLSAAALAAAATRLRRSESYAKSLLLDHELETGRTAKATFGGVQSGQPITPRLSDVMHSLALDADVLDAADFESWASDLGYDTDSRSAEAIYRAGLEIAIKLRAGLGSAFLDELRLAARFN